MQFVIILSCVVSYLVRKLKHTYFNLMRNVRLIVTYRLKTVQRCGTCREKKQDCLQ